MRKIKNRKQKCKDFSWADVIRGLHFLMSFLFFYSVTVFVFFNRYQAEEVRALGGEIRFQPVLYLGTFPAFLLLYLISRKVVRLPVILLLDTVIAIGFAWLFPIAGEKYLLGIILAAYAAADTVLLENIEKRGDADTEIVFTKRSGTYWGIGIVIVLALQMLTASAKSKLPVSAEDVMRLLCVVFLAYVIFYMAARYCFLFYEQGRAMESRQCARALSFVILFLAVGCAGLLLLAVLLKYLLGSYASVLLEAFVELASLAGLSLGDSEYASWFESDGPDMRNFNEMMASMPAKTEPSVTLGNGILLLLFLALLCAAAVIVLRKLSHKKLYHVKKQGETAATDAKLMRLPQTQEKHFKSVRYGNSPDERVRRQYRSLILCESEKKNLTSLGTLTAEELEHEVLRWGNCEEEMPMTEKREDKVLRRSKSFEEETPMTEKREDKVLWRSKSFEEETPMTEKREDKVQQREKNEKEKLDSRTLDGAEDRLQASVEYGKDADLQRLTAIYNEARYADRSVVSDEAKWFTWYCRRRRRS